MGVTTQPKWSDKHTNALKKYHEAGMSFSDSAAQINAEFGTSYSRNAAIGRATRIGLVSPREKKPAPARQRHRERKPRVRIIAAHSKSNFQRVFETVESEPIKLRCAEVVPLNISIDQLESGVCHYPYGETPPYAYCGHAALGGPYCGLHHELCHTPAGATRGRERPDSGAILRHSLLPAVFALACVGDSEVA